MITQVKQKEKVRKQIIDFAIQGVENFLKENPKLEFYAFAFDCNAEYAEVNLCFNTEQDFQKTLKHYQSGDFAEQYQSEEDIKELKFNTGDWKYQCFDTLYVFTDEELSEIFNEFPDDDYKSWKEFVKNLLDLCTESLVEFTKTETYTKILKTRDFAAFCIDHDEDIEQAMERLKNYQTNNTT
jgi:hypothetical protein